MTVKLIAHTGITSAAARTHRHASHDRPCRVPGSWNGRVPVSMSLRIPAAYQEGREEQGLPSAAVPPRVDALNDRECGDGEPASRHGPPPAEPVVQAHSQQRGGCRKG